MRATRRMSSQGRFCACVLGLLLALLDVACGGGGGSGGGGEPQIVVARLGTSP